MVRYLSLAALAWALLAAGARAQPAGGAAAPAGDERRELEVRTLEERVSDLKEKISRTKERLTTLQEAVIDADGSAGAKAVLVHRNEMGSSFRLESVSYALDGAPIYAKADVEGDLASRGVLEVFDGRVAPGGHQISVELVYRGNGHGLFSYVDGYRFKVRSAYTFDAEPGKVSTVEIVGFEQGGLTAELEDRPAIRYVVDVQPEEPGPRAVPAALGAER